MLLFLFFRTDAVKKLRSRRCGLATAPPVAKHLQKVSCYYDCSFKRQDRLGLVILGQSLVPQRIVARAWPTPPSLSQVTPQHHAHVAAMNKSVALTNKPHTRAEAMLLVFHRLGGASRADAQGCPEKPMWQAARDPPKLSFSNC
jgi:hypothetical protein